MKEYTKVIGLGIILMVLGLGVLAYAYTSYFTSKDTENITETPLDARLTIYFKDGSSTELTRGMALLYNSKEIDYIMVSPKVTLQFKGDLQYFDFSYSIYAKISSNTGSSPSTSPTIIVSKSNTYHVTKDMIGITDNGDGTYTTYVYLPALKFTASSLESGITSKWGNYYGSVTIRYSVSVSVSAQFGLDKDSMGLSGYVDFTTTRSDLGGLIGGKVEPTFNVTEATSGDNVAPPNAMVIFPRRSGLL